MKKSFLLIWIAVVFSVSTGADSQYSKALGIIIGEPTGISFKMYNTPTHAFDAGLGWSFGKNSHLHIHGDYLVHRYKLIMIEEGEIPVYFGIGARMRLNDETRLGIRFPVGINYIFENHPLDLFFELVPILDVVPGSDFDMGAGIGIRYHFK